MQDRMMQDADAVVIGSGFGGAMAAHALARAGERVLVLERGPWMERGPESWHPVRGFFQLTPGFTRRTSYRVHQRDGSRVDAEGVCACVGGPSLFYGGASFRFREIDFEARPEIAAGSGAEWPFGYGELQPYYALAERLLGVGGQAGDDPTEPPHQEAYPRPPEPLPPISRRVAEAASRLGLRPFHIPLALNHTEARGGECVTCDGYICRAGGKNDLEQRILNPLHESGELSVRAETVVVRLVEEAGRAVAAECVDARTGERMVVRGRRFILSAGALASPHLLLASGLERSNPAGRYVGRFLMRHCNAFVYGFFARPPDPEATHHKRIAINDFYFGDPDAAAPRGKLGNLQQIMAPQTGGILRWTAGLGRAAALVQNGLGPRAVRGLTRHMTGLQVIAEDQPREDNRIEIDPAETDDFGLPAPHVHHRYTRRDLAARDALVRRARQILKEAGALATYTYPVTTFSHAVGTVRAGNDPETAPLDGDCRFRGLDNLYVLDGSFMPTAAGVNPSLTIAANALRVGEKLSTRLPEYQSTGENG